jgi:hypothetical protein
MIDKSSLRRLVENEAVFRQHNEKAQHSLMALDMLAAQEGDVAPDTGELVLHFYCECSDENCRQRVAVKVDEYANIHRNRQCFVVVPGHEVNAIEKVVTRTPAYMVVEKFADAPEQPQKLNKTAVNNV